MSSADGYSKCKNTLPPPCRSKCIASLASPTGGTNHHLQSLLQAYLLASPQLHQAPTYPETQTSATPPPFPILSALKAEDRTGLFLRCFYDSLGLNSWTYLLPLNSSINPVNKYLQNAYFVATHCARHRAHKSCPSFRGRADSKQEPAPLWSVL